MTSMAPCARGIPSSAVAGTGDCRTLGRRAESALKRRPAGPGLARSSAPPPATAGGRQDGAACRAGRYGQPVLGGPEDTRRLTVVPISTRLPALGLVETTRPGRTSQLWVLLVSPTARPAERIAELATSTVSSVVPGTRTFLLQVTRVTSCPVPSAWPAGGLLPTTRPWLPLSH